MTRPKYRCTFDVEKLKELATNRYVDFDNDNVHVRVQISDNIDLTIKELNLEEIFKHIPFNPKTVN